MQNDIFNLLLMILMLENGGGEECINQMILMFLMMQSRSGGLPQGRTSCDREEIGRASCRERV